MGVLLQRRNPTWHTDPSHLDLVGWSLAAVNGIAESNIVKLAEFSTTGNGLQLRVVGGKGVKVGFPLQGLPLAALDVSHTGIRDLRFTRGMPLELLNLSHTGISRLHELEALPLKELHLEGHKKVDAGRIARLQTLEVLVVSENTHLSGKHIYLGDIEVIRK
jgi:hypothetical protein